MLLHLVLLPNAEPHHLSIAWSRRDDLTDAGHVMYMLQVSFVPITADAAPPHQQPASTSSQKHGHSPGKKRKRGSSDESDDSQNDVRNDRSRAAGQKVRFEHSSSTTRQRRDDQERHGQSSIGKERERSSKHSKHRSDSKHTGDRADTDSHAAQNADDTTENDRYT